jgi:hypothetical protein
MKKRYPFYQQGKYAYLMADQDNDGNENQLQR